MESKLPPFYVGQKVVYVGLRGLFPKDKTLIVSAVAQGSCGCWVIAIQGSMYDKIKHTPGKYCSICDGIETTGVSGYIPRIFRAVESQPFPLITLTQIQTKELEKEQVKEYDKQLIGKN